MLADLMRPHEGGGEKLLLVPLPCDCSLLLLPATLWACAELYQCLSCLSSLLHCGHITETHITSRYTDQQQHWRAVHTIRALFSTRLPQEAGALKKSDFRVRHFGTLFIVTATLYQCVI
jgi:hypothetical protein